MIVADGKHYLYRHIRLDKNEPFYIGVGTKHRKVSPFYRAETVKNRNEIWTGIYNKTPIEVEILMESDSVEFLMQKEMEFISLYGRLYKNEGCLANMDMGGYTNRSGRTESAREKASKRMIALNKEMAKKRVGTTHFYKTVVPVNVYDTNGYLLGCFKSCAEAARYFNVEYKYFNYRLRHKTSYKNLYFICPQNEMFDILKYSIEEDTHLVKKVAAYNSDGVLIKIYDTMGEAANGSGLKSRNAVRLCINKNRPTRKGVTFKIYK